MTAADFHAARERLARLNIERQFATGAMREHLDNAAAIPQRQLDALAEGLVQEEDMRDAIIINAMLAALRMASDELYHRASSHDGDGRYTCAGPGYCPKCTVDDVIAKAETSIKEKNNAVHPK